MKIKIVKHFSQYTQYYRIYWRESMIGEITVSRNTTIDGTGWKPAEINWPGCGDQSELSTMIFMLALQIAIYLCRTLNGTTTLYLAELNKICQCEMVDPAGNPVAIE